MTAFPPPARPAGSSFFDWIRRQQVFRGPDRWIGGVASGLARRLGWDPVLVRGLFIVAAIFSGLGLLLYGAAWLAVPDAATGRSHLEDAVEGRFSPGFWGSAALTACGAVMVFVWMPTTFPWGMFWLATLAAAVVIVCAYAFNRPPTPAQQPQFAAPPPGQPNPGGPVPPTYPAPDAVQPFPAPAGASAPPARPPAPAPPFAPPNSSVPAAAGAATAVMAEPMPNDLIPASTQQLPGGSGEPMPEPLSAQPKEETPAQPSPGEPATEAGGPGGDPQSDLQALPDPPADQDRDFTRKEAGTTAAGDPQSDLQALPDPPADQDRDFTRTEAPATAAEAPTEPLTAQLPGQGEQPGAESTGQAGTAPASTAPAQGGQGAGGGWTAPGKGGGNGGWPPGAGTPPARRAKGGALTLALLGLMLLAIAGVVAISRYTDLLSGFVVMGLCLGGALVVMGVGLVILGMAGRRAGGFIAAAIVLALFAAPLAGGAQALRMVNGSVTVGSYDYSPSTRADAAAGYSIGAGELSVNLTDPALRGEDLTVDVSVGVGQAILTVPSSGAVVINATVSTGAIELSGFDRDEWLVDWSAAGVRGRGWHGSSTGSVWEIDRGEDELGGLNVSLRAETLSAGDGPTLTINYRGTIGNLEIYQEDSRIWGIR
ncbi:MAG: PspC domain-containing protein [Bifidobacteriaceae bacterium]|jgi:phage shock protein PspC (stress-responsive transcriptional regulator)|nr:PspC domain-containing protein [Bifidobacteriaceae bacterium]